MGAKNHATAILSEGLNKLYNHSTKYSSNKNSETKVIDIHDTDMVWYLMSCPYFFHSEQNFGTLRAFFFSMKNTLKVSVNVSF
jgi:hypothetical protein